MDVTSQLRSFALDRKAVEQYGSRKAVEQYNSSQGQHPSANPAADTVAQEKRGATIIVDNFLSSASHGYKVKGAAKSIGFTGPTYQVSSFQEVDGRITMPHAKALKELQAGFTASSLDAKQASEQLNQFIIQATAGNLKVATQHLEKIESHGFQNSVVNFSQGIDAIGIMDMIKMALGPNSKLSVEKQQLYGQNLQSALLGPSEQDLAGDNSVDKRLLKKVSALLKESPEIQAAVSDWSSEVRSFESAHNSVVVAAGNSGNAYKALAHSGFTLDGSEDFNLLCTPEVTSVGATSQTPSGDISLASSSSFGPEVDIIAEGEFQGAFGTSYAAPKVANVLRAIHLLRPNFTSDEAEGFLRDNLSSSVELLDSTVGLLDTQKGAYLLSALEQKLQQR